MSSITLTPGTFPRATFPKPADYGSSRTQLHLTRRGRVFLTVLVSVPLAAAVLVFLLFGRGLGAVAGVGVGAGTPATAVSHITVMPGQSLWQIAENVAPRSDPRTVVSELISFNGLSGSTVMPGQSLAVPAGL